MAPRLLDLFSGSKSVSNFFESKGWKVVTVDNEPGCHADYIEDLLEFMPPGDYDLIWASPPCTEFSKSFMPWYKGIIPDMRLVDRAFEIAEIKKPKYFILENVLGSVRWIKPKYGAYRLRCGSRYLWGDFPLFTVNHKLCYGKWRLPPSENRVLLRGMIPQELLTRLYEQL